MDRAVPSERIHRPGRALRIALLAASLAVLALPASAGAYVYWSNVFGEIDRANLDGSEADYHFIDGTGQRSGLAVDGTHLYWANPDANTIGRADLDGSAVNQSFITGVTPCGLAVDGAHVYWTTANWWTPGTGTISRANLDGSGVDPGFITGLDRPCPTAVDGAHVYWGTSNGDGNNPIGTIGRAGLDGSGVDENFITGTSLLNGIAVDAAHIYWANGDIPESIGRANLDGSAVDQQVIDTNGVPTGVAVDSLPDASATATSCLPATVTFPAAVQCTVTVTDTSAAETAPSAPTGAVAFSSDRAGTFTGAGRCALVATSGSQAACAVTYTALGPGVQTLTASYAGDYAHARSTGSTSVAVAKPSNAFTLAQPQLDRQEGTATVIAKVPGVGKLRVAGYGIEQLSKRARDSGKLKLPIKPTSATRRKLERAGSVKVKPRFTYRPPGGDPRTRSMRLTLKLNGR